MRWIAFRRRGKETRRHKYPRYHRPYVLAPDRRSRGIVEWNVGVADAVEKALRVGNADESGLGRAADDGVDPRVLWIERPNDDVASSKLRSSVA